MEVGGVGSVLLPLCEPLSHLAGSVCLTFQYLRRLVCTFDGASDSSTSHKLRLQMCDTMAVGFVVLA